MVTGSLLVLARAASEAFLDQLVLLFLSLQGRLVLCLLGLFLFGIALLGLLVETLFGLCLFLVILPGLVTAEGQAARVDEA